METVIWLKRLFDYLGGAEDSPPPSAPHFLVTPAFIGLWWAILAIVVLAFSGQTSKFIYIDF
jgi:hypothetical protein